MVNELVTGGDLRCVFRAPLCLWRGIVNGIRARLIELISKHLEGADKELWAALMEPEVQNLDLTVCAAATGLML